jgi:hypothetical protein
MIFGARQRAKPASGRKRSVIRDNRREDGIEPTGQNRRHEEARDQAGSKRLAPFLTDTERQRLRLYNSATGKCDLTEEQAEERERRREIYNRAADEELERRRQERLERWRNTPLDTEAQEALGGLPPLRVWQDVQTLVSQAFQAYPEESDALLEKYPGVSEDRLILALSHLNPVVGVNNLVAVNSDPKLDLQNLLKSANPPDVLENVLFMVTLSDKWLTEVAI